MRAKPSQAGFTLVELLLVLLVLFALASMILPFLADRGKKPGPKSALRCTQNLRQVGVAYQIWADDHGGRLPAETPISEGGWQELLTNSNAGRYCWTNYALMWPYLKSGSVVICGADTRKPSTGKDGKETAARGNLDVSFFVGVTASLRNPQSVLGGDRNLSAGSTPRKDFGFSPVDGSGNDVVIQAAQKSAYCWSLTMHSGATSHAPHPAGVGNLLFADGSTRVLRGSYLGRCFANAGLPESDGDTNSSSQTQQPGPGIRLVFP